ncbi:MAG: LarC family nickel insertion protein [Gammaproteobacteria bacterium]|nr:LarC family nickel insertion protein [Gammaproteobacteria bacterium]
MHYHLDPVGGVAGDMFVAALLDMEPDSTAATLAAIRDSGLDPSVAVSHDDFNDGVLTGSRFTVGKPECTHHHAHWSAIKKNLSDSALSPAVTDRAIAIFADLAEAEAKVHNKAVSDVAFHEVGAWDSIADIVAAAYLIESLGPCTWSIGPIPIGKGRVKTEHGLLPVPAPATVLLLDGFEFIDDGFPGERITPTGAAIIKHLKPSQGIGKTARVLQRSGYGFGTRTFKGMSNILRVLEFSKTTTSSVFSCDTVMVLNFEIDDQTAEELAVGLQKIRERQGVIDVIQSPVMGKKGRLLTSVQVLVRPGNAEDVINVCFHETTTLGIRQQVKARAILNRSELETEQDIRVKIVERPGGITAKADIDNIANIDGHQHRQKRRLDAQSDALTDK